MDIAADLVRYVVIVENIVDIEVLKKDKLVKDKRKKSRVDVKTPQVSKNNNSLSLDSCYF